MDLTQLVAKLRGKFIVVDGPDGAGKSTQRELLADSLVRAGADIVRCRDPGGTAIGDRIRSVLLDYDLTSMDVRCEAMLFMASRAQLVSEIIQPALQANQTVLCDRYVTSTCAYQGAAGYDPKRVMELARFAIGDTWPSVTLLVDLPAEDGFARIGRKPKHAGKNRGANSGAATLFDGVEPDAMEARSTEFHRRVRKIFLEVHAYYPTPVVTVDGRGDRQTVHERILEALARVPC